MSRFVRVVRGSSVEKMECDQRAYERPAFWRIPKAKTFEIPFMKKRVSFSEKVSQFGRAVGAHTQ